MQFYAAAASGNIEPVDMVTFERIRAVLKVLPDLVFDPTEREWSGCKNQISCHLICRALATHFGGTVHDGYFVKGYQHSWLTPPSGSSIIDAYPVAGAAPFIVAKNPASPWPRLYHDSNELNGKFKTKQFLERLARTTAVVGDTVKQLGYL